MRTHPRERGRRLHTLGVIAENVCNGSPNLSSDSGWTCHSMFAVGCVSSLRANAPSCDGGMVNGPVLNNAYSAAMTAFPNRLFTRSFNVTVLLTLYCMRICR